MVILNYIYYGTFTSLHYKLKFVTKAAVTPLLEGAIRVREKLYYI